MIPMLYNNNVLVTMLLYIIHEVNYSSLHRTHSAIIFFVNPPEVECLSLYVLQNVGFIRKRYFNLFSVLIT